MTDGENIELAVRWLREMSDADDVAIGAFFNALGAGMFDEWDCDLSRAFAIFGEGEIRLAAKTGVHYAESWAAVEGEAEEL